MLTIILIGAAISAVRAEYGLPGLDLGLHGSPALLPAPIYSPPIIKTLPAPIYAPPWIKAAPLPLYAPAPIIKSLPLSLPLPVAPIVKTIAPTSYATVTRFHITHTAPIVKTILAPQPILKSYIPAPIAISHGYH